MTWEVKDSMMQMTISPIQQLSKDRGHETNMEAFLNPNLDQLHDPMLMKDMKEARDRTIQAIENGEKILVAGDYDADGISSTYAMMRLLGEAGSKVSYEIPERKKGYGLSKEMIDNAYRDGCTLVITCDNGIACVD